MTEYCIKKHFIKKHFSTHWGEMDALGHINHTRYLVWMETVRIELFEQIGLMNIPNVGPILANINANYHHPIHHPAELWCGVRVTRIGTKSFTLQYAIGFAGEEKQLAEATTVIVVYNYQTNCSVEIPELVRLALQPENRAALDQST